MKYTVYVIHVSQKTKFTYVENVKLVYSGSVTRLFVRRDLFSIRKLYIFVYLTIKKMSNLL